MNAYFSLSADAVPFSGNITDMASKMRSLGKLLCVEDAELVLAAKISKYDVIYIGVLLNRNDVVFSREHSRSQI